MRWLPQSGRSLVLCSVLLLSAVMAGAGIWGSARDLSRRWPAVQTGFAEALLERIGNDPELVRRGADRELAVLDSLRTKQWLLPRWLEPGRAELSSGGGGDTLADWIGLSRLWGGGSESSFLVPRRLRSGRLDSMSADLRRLASRVHPSGEDLLLASLLLGAERLARFGAPPSDKDLLRCMVRARRLRERFRPGAWRAMVEADRAARGERMLREAMCWRALDALADSWGVPDSAKGEIRAVADSLGLQEALRQARPKDPAWLGLLREALRYEDLEHAAGERLPEGFPGKAALASDTLWLRRVTERLRLLGYGEVDSGEGGDSVPGPIPSASVERLRYNRGLRLGVGWDDTLWQELTRPDSLVRQRLCSTLVQLTRTPWRRERFCLRVNIPEYRLEVLEDGAVLRQHRVVVGRDSVGRFTPVLSSSVDHVVINPQWHVPSKILREEILEGREPDAALLRSKGYEPKYGKEGEITGAYQPSGEENALGKVKFLFANRFGVYLHDTPSRHLFARSRRSYSHGCVRVQDPLRLADFLLARDGNRWAGKLDSLVDEEDQKWVKLKLPVPIHLEYRTVTLDSAGRACFLRDVYALARERARLEKEKEKAAKRAALLNAGRDCSRSGPRRSSPGTDTKPR